MAMAIAPAAVHAATLEREIAWVSSLIEGR